MSIFPGPVDTKTNATKALGETVGLGRSSQKRAKIIQNLLKCIAADVRSCFIVWIRRPKRRKRLRKGRKLADEIVAGTPTSGLHQDLWTCQ
ncbi:hypothetical protein MLD38_028221 [Melastoma candidum]|uniref:Uncharacterized protein n=1 Tax=Melastoma candidum TaxID=119954 RepID=A0ACB9N0G8_9MYRT|nr:hypothetical protein MLD38_028221 [Melastoma candidum]